MYFSKEFPYISVYCFSCRYLVELGQQLGLPAPKECGQMSETHFLDMDALKIAPAIVLHPVLQLPCFIVGAERARGSCQSHILYMTLPHNCNKNGRTITYSSCLTRPVQRISLLLVSGHVRPRQGTEICYRGAVSTGFFEFSPVDFFFCSRFTV